MKISYHFEVKNLLRFAQSPCLPLTRGVAEQSEVGGREFYSNRIADTAMFAQQTIHEHQLNSW